MLNGALFVVTDNPASFPKPDAVLSEGNPSAPVAQELIFLTRRQAVETLGYNAHRYVLRCCLTFIGINLVLQNGGHFYPLP
jgi:histidine ammonia-lyase